jgi:small redox-active disulfide protein 2
MAIEIKVLGPGCAKCKTLQSAVNEVVAENNYDATVIKVEDIMDIMSYNIVATPALVINGSVVIKGKVPSKAEIKQKIEDAING